MNSDRSRMVEVAQHAEASLGEGPAWDESRELLIWVDITNRRVHQWNPATGRDEVIAVDRFVGAAVPWKRGHIALAVADGFGDLDSTTGSFAMLGPLTPTDKPSRMNDAKCDGAGRYWGGTIALDLSPGAGKLYRLDLEGSVDVMLDGLHISNGLGWSPDNRVMYLIDSFAYTLYAFDFDLESGSIADRRPLIEVPEADGVMDGMTVDGEGCLWVAIFGGSEVRRYKPDGELIDRIAMPVTHPTSCVFGGLDLADLYITSARQDVNGPMDEAQLTKQPLAGSVFHLRPGVIGLPTNPFRGRSV